MGRFILQLFGQAKSAIKAASLYCPAPMAHCLSICRGHPFTISTQAQTDLSFRLIVLEIICSSGQKSLEDVTLWKNDDHFGSLGLFNRENEVMSLNGTYPLTTHVFGGKARIQKMVLSVKYVSLCGS